MAFYVDETTIPGLYQIQDDTTITYTKNSGTDVTMCGEWASGEVWIGEKRYQYQRSEDKIVLEHDDGTVYLLIDDSDEAWDQFVDGVI